MATGSGDSAADDGLPDGPVGQISRESAALPGPLGVDGHPPSALWSGHTHGVGVSRLGIPLLPVPQLRGNHSAFDHANLAVPAQSKERRSASHL
jgi:hypothetical protein